MSFQSIKGQDRAIGILKVNLGNVSLSGAYLFSGQEGIGKLATALNLAKAVNCLEENDDACDTCNSCLKIEKKQHPDVHLIDSDTPIMLNADTDKEETRDSRKIRIGHIRQLQKQIIFKPYEGRKKVFIIDEAHNLTPDASGALLKTLEESPANSLIILVSSKPNMLFKTIVSRCKIIRFLPLQRKRLKEILKEDYAAADDLAHFLSYFSEGRMGAALRVKEAGVFKERDAVVDSFILSGRRRVDQAPAQDRDRIRRDLNILVGWFRDIYLLKTGLPHAELINFDRKEELLRLMSRYTFAELDEIMSSIADSLLYLEQNVNPRLLLSNLRMGIWKA